MDIVLRGCRSILSYYDSLNGITLPLNEVRLLLVGEGGAGKTSIVKQLLDEAFDAEEPQTHGITIRTKKFGDFTSHLWDFGGQEIMHATHQFFLSKRSVYLLVLDGRNTKSESEFAEYWLKHIESFGGNSPVIVVLNKIDDNPAFEVNRSTLRKKYPTIREFFRVSCQTQKGVPELKEFIQQLLPQVDMVQSPFSSAWFQVKEELSMLQDNYISYERYCTLCQEHTIEQNSAQKTLLRFLHDLGIIIHFEKYPSIQILNPKWLTNGVYKIITSPQVAQQEGLFTPQTLDTILNAQTEDDYYYPPDKYRYIINVMQEFKLCYELPHQEDIFLIPDLLPVEEPAFDFDQDNALQFRFQYDFLSRSIMPRFIVRMHQEIDEELRWRTGVVLQDEDSGCRALIKADYADKLISIWVNGERKRDYFAIIRKNLREIHQSFQKLDVQEIIPLSGGGSVAYKELVGLEKMGKQSYDHGMTQHTYEISKLLGSIEKPEERREKNKQHELMTHPININISNDNRSSSHSQSDASAQATANVSVKNENVQQLATTFHLLREDLLDEVPQGEERKKLEKDLTKVEKALEEVKLLKSKEETKTSPAMKRLRKFIENMSDDSKRIGKTLKAVEDGIGYAQDIAKFYNSIAQWCALPVVPEPLLKKIK